MSKVVKTEGVTGLWRGTVLALVGVGNRAIQFMAYEKMKAWGFETKRRKAELDGIAFDPNTAKLVRFCIRLP